MNPQNSETCTSVNLRFLFHLAKKKTFTFPHCFSLSLSLGKKTESEFIDPVKFIWEIALKPWTKINSSL